MSEKNAKPPVPEPFTTSRIFNAPVDLVFRAWTEPKWIMRWWGPRGFTSPYCKVDLRVGGTFHYCMRSPNGQDFWNVGSFLEVQAPARIVSTIQLGDKDGNVVKPSFYGMGPGFPEIMKDIVTFEALPGGRTRLTLVRDTPREIAQRIGMEQGWNSSLDKFAELFQEMLSE